MPKRGSYNHKKKTYNYGDLKVEFVISFPNQLEKKDKELIRDVLKQVR